MNKNKYPRVVLLPGPAGAGRDFLLSLLKANQHVIEQRYGQPVRIGIAQKITDRQSRGENDALKKCVTTEEFEKGIKSGRIIAPYILESNGKQYGYEVDAFDSSEHDVLFADASVYQIPHLRKQLKDRAHIVAMVNSRADREANMLKRGTEKPDEIERRLNLGDGHVALLCRMAGVSYHNFIHPELLSHLESGDGEKTRLFTGSDSVYVTYRDIDGDGIVDEIWHIDSKYRIEDGDNPLQTKFFERGVEIVLGALPQNA